jgi:hypothetical protein
MRESIIESNSKINMYEVYIKKSINKKEYENNNSNKSSFLNDKERITQVTKLMNKIANLYKIQICKICKFKFKSNKRKNHCRTCCNHK